MSACQSGQDPGEDGDTQVKDSESQKDKLRDEPDADQDSDSDSSDSGDSDSGDTNDPQAKPKPFAPPEPQLRALLGLQYKASVRDLLGASAAQVATPPSDPSPINGFAAIGASQLSIDSSAVEQYETSAIAIARAAIQDKAHIDDLAGCSPSKAKNCYTQFVKNFGLRIFRRPLHASELARYANLMKGGEYYARVQIAITAMLQSPNFLYQIESGQAVAGDKSKRKLSGYEVATRLSYFLLGTTPSPELLAAAKNGELDTAKGIRAVAVEMLQDPKAREALSAFWYEMLDLSHIEPNGKDQKIFNSWTPALANSVKKETLTFLDKVIWDGSGNFKELWTADYSYVNRDIASLYGLSTKGRNSNFVKTTLPKDSKRAGLLGQASFLASVSHSTTTSPTLRGKHVMEKFLCVVIPAPPPEAMTEFKPTSGKAKTKAELLKEHVEQKSCQSCHKLMDPIGLGLENFDAIGRFRFKENGVVLETEQDAATLGTFDGPKELGALIAEDKRSHDCLTRNLFRFATGHIETEGEVGSIQSMTEAFEQADYDIPTLLVEIVSSPAFRYVGENNE